MMIATVDILVLLVSCRFWYLLRQDLYQVTNKMFSCIQNLFIYYYIIIVVELGLMLYVEFQEIIKIYTPIS